MSGNVPIVCSCRFIILLVTGRCSADFIKSNASILLRKNSESGAVCYCHDFVDLIVSDHNAG